MLDNEMKVNTSLYKNLFETANKN